MSQRSRGVTVLLPIGAVLGEVLSVRMIMAGASDNPVWFLIGGVAAVVVGVSAWGMWRLRRWALWVSWVLAATVFALGCYGAYFMWSFWLFKEPTLGERIKAVLNPQLLPYLLCPLIWLVYFTRPRVRAQFFRTPNRQAQPTRPATPS